MVRFSLSCWIVSLCVLAFFRDLSFAQSSTGGNLADVRITRVSGCTDVGDVTIDCPRGSPLSLTLYGAGFDSLEQEHLLLRLQEADNPNYSRSLSITSINDTVITGSVSVYGFSFWSTAMQNVTINLYSESESYYELITFKESVAFVAPIPWSITGLSGCPVIDGLTARQCDWTAGITIIGTGLSVFDGNIGNPRVSIGSVATLIQNTTLFLRVIDDSHMFINVINDGYLRVPVEARSGNPMPLTVSFPQAPLFSIDDISLGYSKFPAIEVANLQATFCETESNNGVTRFSDCHQGYSVITINGKYMWDVQASIGGQPAVVESRNTGQVTVKPAGVDYEHGVYYDITLTNTEGSVTIPGVVNFISTTQISGWKPCVAKPHVPTTGRCLKGETFTIKVVNMQGRTTPPQVVFERLDWEPCINTRIVDESTIQCTVGSDPDGAGQTLSSWYLSWPDYNTSFAPDRIHVWDEPDAPRINKVFGPACYQSADSSMPLQCSVDRTGDFYMNFSIHTTIFPPNKSWYLAFWRIDQLSSVSRSSVVNASVADKSTVEARWYLSDETRLLNVGKLYLVGLADDNLWTDRGITSNVIQMRLVDQIVYDAATSKSSATAIALGVVLPISAVAALMVAYYCYRTKKQQKPLFISQNDSASTEVEMS